MGVAKAITWSAGAQYACFMIQFACSIAIARWFLDPEDIGVFSVTMSVYFILSACQDFGLSRYIIQKRDISRDELRSAYTLFFCASFILCVAILAASPYIGKTFNDERASTIANVLALNFMAAPFGLPAYAMLQRDMQFESLFVVNVGSAVLSAMVSLVLASMNFGAVSLAYAAAAGQITRNILSFIYRRDQMVLGFSFKGFGAILRFGSVISWMNVFGTLCMRSPEIIIGRFSSMAAVGLYGRGTGLADQLRWLLGAAVTAAAFPAFVRIRDSGGNLGSAYVRLTACFTAVIWPAFALLATLSAEIIDLLFGPKWSEAAPVVLWLSLSQLFFAAVPSHTDVLTVTGRLRLMVGVNLVDGLAGVLLFIAFASGGADDAAFSRIIYGTLFVFLYLPFLRSILGIRIAHLAGAYGASALIVAATMLPLVPVLAWYKPGLVPVPVWTASVCICAACWLASLWLLRHPLWTELSLLSASFRRDRFELVSAEVNK